MIPSVLSNQVREGVEDFLKTTFPVSTPFFPGVMDRFLGEFSSIAILRLPHKGGRYVDGIRVINRKWDQWTTRLP